MGAHIFSRRLFGALLAFGVGSLTTRPSRAFTYGEHHDIGAEAVRRLAPEPRARFTSAWPSIDGNGHTCAAPGAEPMSERKEGACIGFGDLTALAADHSCNVAELGDEIRHQDWVVRVIDRAMATRREMQRPGVADFKQLWRRSDIDLQLIDASYGSRAAANDAHFAIARASDALGPYLFEALEIDAPPLNAVGLYAIFHGAALRLATEAQEGSREPRRVALREKALLSEAFALHFLQDLFSSGHIVGTFGSVATKKGTHDDYSWRGLDVRTWRGVSYEAHGDAHMTSDDLEHASIAVATSVRQLMDAYAGVTEVTTRAGAIPLEAADAMSKVDVCTATTAPKGLVPYALWPLLEEVLGQTPMPARATTLLPRSSAEVGAFFGAWVGLRSAASFGDGAANPLESTFADLELSLRLGVNLQDVLGPVSDGQFLLEAGTLVGTQQIAVGASDPRHIAGDTRLIPHQGNKFALRMPFYVIPGDLLLAAPLLFFLSPRTLQSMALTAAYGGLVPWQRPLTTRAGVVQFILGRKVEFFLNRQRVLESYAADGAAPEILVFRSYTFGFPIVEWTPLRDYHASDASGFKVQLGVAFEIPYSARNLSTAQEWLAPRSTTQLVLGLGLWGHRYL